MERIAEPSSLQLEFSKRLPRVILASSSPNRKALLEKGGTAVTTFSPNVNEERDESNPVGTMLRIVRAKFNAYLESDAYNPSMVAIAADTLVLKDGRLLGKPKDRDDARRMLEMLSGERQKVLTAVGLHIPNKGNEFFLDSADVVFKKLSEDNFDSYLATEEWNGAAGGYRLQKAGYKLVDRIDGDWTTVVGLPLKAILQRL